MTAINLSISEPNQLSASEPNRLFNSSPRSITCIECKNEFVFSVGEQDFFRNHGFCNEPKRCQHCRVLMRMRREGKSTDSVTQTNCAVCGEKTTVPFLARNEKKIFCTACYKTKRFMQETVSLA